MIDRVYSYANAIRERVFVPVPGVDQDGDGIADQMAIEIIRPRHGSSATPARRTD
jgi:X-Pro dipeptidyl-peptidase